MNAGTKRSPHGDPAFLSQTPSNPLSSAAKLRSYRRAVIHKLSVLLLAVIAVNIFGCGGGGGGNGSIPTPSPKPTATPEPTPAAELTKITVTPAQAKVACGLSVQLQALGTYSDGSSQDVTQKAAWKSSSNKTASADAGEVCGLAAGQTEVTAELDGIVSNRAKITVTAAEPVSCLIFSASGKVITDKLLLNAGETQQLKAQVQLSDGSSMDVTNSVIWSSAKPGVASVSEKGVITAKEAGTSKVTVKNAAGETFGSFQAVVAADKVTGVSLNKSKLTLAAGYTEVISASATYSSGRTVNIDSSAKWSSSDKSVASVEVKTVSGKTKASVSGQKPGQAVVTASFGGKSASCTVKVTDAELVSLVAKPQSLNIPKGLTANITVTGGFSDGTGRDITDDCRFLTGDENIAAAESAGKSTTAGLVRGVGKGSTVITVQKDKLKAEVEVTVSDAELKSLSVSSESASVIAGYSLQLEADASYSDGTSVKVTSEAEWTSGAPDTASVAKGKVTGLAAGTVTVTAKFGGKTASKKITVSKAVLTSLDIDAGSGKVSSGLTLQLKAAAYYSDGTVSVVTGEVEWRSRDTGTAIVDDNGLVTGKAAGNVTIEAKFAGKTFTQDITVTAAVVTRVAVTPDSASVIVGNTAELTATAYYSDGSSSTVTADDECEWTSEVPEKVIVDKGEVTGVAPTDSDVEVTASFGGFEGSALISVPEATSFTFTVGSAEVTDGATVDLTVGETLEVQAGVTFSDGQEIEDAVSLIEWTLGEGGGDIVEIDQETGAITGKAAGETAVTADLYGLQISFSINVAADAEAVTLTQDVLTEELGYTFGREGLQKDGQYVTELELPETFTYDGNTYRITAIGAGAFKNCSHLTKVTIPDGVTAIGDEAFSGCVNISELIIPDSVTSIGYETFRYLPVLDTLTIPSNLTFAEGCPKGTRTTITPGSMKAINEGAFEDNSELAEVTISDGITSIGASAFARSGISSVSIPGSVKSIGEYAFTECDLTSITISSGVESIGDYAFQRNTVTELEIPGSVRSIGAHAFANSSALTEVIIPDGVETVGASAFGECEQLEMVSVPCGAEFPEGCPFTDSSNLTHAAITKTDSGSTSLGDYAFDGCDSLKSVIIPAGVTSIGNNAFNGCGLTSISLPSSVVTIGDYAFEGCGSLTSVTIKDKVDTIGAFAFSCSGLTSVTISSGVASIGEEAFGCCFGLPSIAVPDSVTAIGDNAFAVIPVVYYNCDGSEPGYPWGACRVLPNTGT